MSNTSRDREATIDRLLAGSMPHASELSADCLDAETLAAWADAGLDAGERAAAEAHAADCARCQAMLAAMVKIAPAPAVSRWRMPAIAWLVPAAAAVTAVLVWVMVPPAPVPPAPLAPVQQSAEADKTTPASAPAPAAPAAAESNTTKAGPVQPPAAPSRATDLNVQRDRLEERAVTAAPPPPAAPSASPAPVAPPPAARAFAAAAASPAVVILSPNPASRWRILPGGGVERSPDGGGTWQTQTTGATVTLTAGASPSPSVCWLVGAGGLVLLSTDGQTWKRLGFPEAVPLTTVRATDDKAATVTAADGRSFATSDGGVTWTQP